MAKYKVEFDRETCIGALPCNSVAPDEFPIAEDKKADLAGGKKNDGNGWFELDIDEDKLEKYKSAAEVCPVNAIHVTNIETGEKII